MAAMSKLGWKLTALAFTLPLGYVARRAVAAGWRAVRHDEPPITGDERDSGWGETLAWAALSGVALAAAELIAYRTAAATWRSITGGEPPGRELGDDEYDD